MSLQRLKVIGFVLPVVVLLAVDVIRHRLWFSTLHSWQGLVLSGIAFTVMSVGFTTVMFRRIEALNAAHARLRAEAEETLSFLQNLVQHSPDAVVVITVERRITLWNHGAESMYGFSQTEAVGSPPLMVPPERRQEYEALLSQVGQGEAIRNFETQRMHKDGHSIDVMVTLSPLRNAQGEVVAVLAIAKDITALKQAERQKHQLGLLMDRQRICMDLHDSTIQSIYGVGLQLEDCCAQVETEPRAVQAALGAAIESLHRVTQDLRAYILDLQPEVKDRGDLAERLADMVAGFEADSLIPVRVRVAAEVSRLFPDQTSHLLQIVREALSNAWRHAGATAVDVIVEAAPAGLSLSIRDNGCGMDPDCRPGDSQMGLRNMAARARAAGGTFQIDSRPGAGTTVSVMVPGPEQVAFAASAERVVP
ncbi:MAG TPA: PAS domain S-box protein [Symbiobacteriaceae bacterium]|nr:PAS domain S-box protein [Symbiobacteriaceae bacterium]